MQRPKPGAADGKGGRTGNDAALSMSEVRVRVCGQAAFLSAAEEGRNGSSAAIVAKRRLGRAARRISSCQSIVA